MIPVPRGLSYLPYQKTGIDFVKDRPAALIADEMGLGKTIQAIGYLNCHPEYETALVVCPASLKTNWAREIDRWLISPCLDVVIINYDQLHKLDMRLAWDVVILDEAQYIKNKSARRTRYCRMIKSKTRIALTGTPILNKPIELWSILSWLDSVAWPRSSYMRYALRYCGAYRNKWGWDVSGATNLDELRQRLEPLMIRRLKKDVLKDLPPKRRQILELPADGLSADLRARMRDAVARIDKIEARYAQDVRRLESAVQVAWSEMSALRHETGLAKLPAALAVIQDAIDSSGKVVIFAHHRDVIEGLRKGLLELSPAVIHGGTPLDLRECMVDAFQRGDTPVFIGQIQAAGTGITLTASSHVIFVELDWVPGVISQAEDRCHRIGQTNFVLVQHLVLENSLDARMAKTLIKKQSIIERALDA